MQASSLVPGPAKRVRFNRGQYLIIPQASGCYVISNAWDDILYIGLSNNLRNRFEQHLDNPGKVNPTQAGVAFWFHFLIYDKKKIRKLENSWLQQFQVNEGVLPILNSIQSVG